MLEQNVGLLVRINQTKGKFYEYFRRIETRRRRNFVHHSR